MSPEQESVWDYPRPPRVEPVAQPLRVVHRGALLARTDRGLRVLETSHPPCYYFPFEDVVAGRLAPWPGRASHCPHKGYATYLLLMEGGTPVAWRYPAPTPDYRMLEGHVSFHSGRVDECWVGDERARPQPGDLGGWITDRIVGPFAGA
ncbi:MAG TPA: DUF427 domain-containing protein [Sandaracinaceae bacterium LLY-WYZ-13_1]|nr:DUF427 domain-containing protein [Sandaracinaceae bacterium LLY-WYZ-13_1]